MLIPETCTVQGPIDQSCSRDLGSFYEKATLYDARFCWALVLAVNIAFVPVYKVIVAYRLDGLNILWLSLPHVLMEGVNLLSLHRVGRAVHILQSRCREPFLVPRAPTICSICLDSTWKISLFQKRWPSAYYFGRSIAEIRWWHWWTIERAGLCKRCVRSVLRLKTETFRLF